MRREESPADAGFTLVEVLVALVVTALLLSIAMNGAIAAKDRANRAAAKQRAVELAASLVDERKVAPFSAAPANGIEDKLQWSVAERVVMADPRGLMLLSEIEATIVNPAGVRLAEVRVRKLKQAPQL